MSVGPKANTYRTKGRWSPRPLCSSSHGLGRAGGQPPRATGGAAVPVPPVPSVAGGGITCGDVE